MQIVGDMLLYMIYWLLNNPIPKQSVTPTDNIEYVEA